MPKKIRLRRISSRRFPIKRRIPVHKRLANFTALLMVDLMVDLDEKGKIIRIEITRWLGYDLDESVKENINRMEWRPASSSGKNLPIRVFITLNFKKVEKD